MSPSAQGAAGPQGGLPGEGRGKNKAEAVTRRRRGWTPSGPAKTGAKKHEGKGKGEASPNALVRNNYRSPKIETAPEKIRARFVYKIDIYNNRRSELRSMPRL